MSNAALRILSAVIGIPVVVGLTYLGGWYFAAFVVLVGVIAQDEVYNLFRATDVVPFRWVGLLAGVLVMVSPLWSMGQPLAVLVLIGLLAASPFLAQSAPILPRMSATVSGVLYPALSLSYGVALRVGVEGALTDTQAFQLTITTLVLIWSTDSFAYFAGRALGKHPLAPKVSPKKTWEGSVGGAVGTLALAIIAKLFWLTWLTWADVAALTLICGMLSQLGDLAESAFKRSVGVKDSGTILPGHGGMLDRNDALLLVLPIVYLYIQYLR
ncbi:MAG: phosphatidate cytidylyltransferase [Rhodothermales bacterium]